MSEHARSFITLALTKDASKRPSVLQVGLGGLKAQGFRVQGLYLGWDFRSCLDPKKHAVLHHPRTHQGRKQAAICPTIGSLGSAHIRCVTVLPGVCPDRTVTHLILPDPQDPPVGRMVLLHHPHTHQGRTQVTIHPTGGL